jgi:soluble lytic murein transglycosylase-like protein
MTITDLLLLGGAGFLGWKIYEAVQDQQSQKTEAQGMPVYMPLVASAAGTAGIPTWALAAIVNTESSWDNSPREKSCSDGCSVPCRASCPPTCAIGLAQLKAKYFAPGGDATALCDPATNLRIAAQHLRDLYAHFKDWNIAFVAYNQGTGTVDSAIKAGKDPIALNSSYVSKTVSAAQRYGAGSALAGSLRLPSLFRVA